MKREGILVLGLFLILVFSISFTFAQTGSETCESLEYECGTFFFSVGGPLICGDCSNGACIAGQCYALGELGECIGEIGENSYCDNFNSNYSCNLVGCEWGLSCVGTPSPCSELQTGCLYQAGCKWENSEKYTISVYWSESVDGPLLPKKIVEVNDYEIEDISLFMVLENSGLLEGTEISFEIYRMISSEDYGDNYEIDIRTGASAIQGVVDAEGNAVAEWIVTKDDLIKAEYDGRGEFYFSPKINGELLSQKMTELVGRTSFHRFSIVLYSERKGGECTGTFISCGVFAGEGADDDCGLAPGCDWITTSNGESYCSGIGLSCGYIEGKKTCENYGCNWESSGFWESFISFFKGLFGRGN